jgi:hypothetical protein
MPSGRRNEYRLPQVRPRIPSPTPGLQTRCRVKLAATYEIQYRPMTRRNYRQTLRADPVIFKRKAETGDPVLRIAYPFRIAMSSCAARKREGSW